MKRQLILTKKQLIAERAHMGSSFNSSNYILLKNNNINEGGAGAFFLSLPAIIKLFRLAIDKGQEYWLKSFNEELYKKIDKRTLASLMDEDSIEDIISQGNLSKNQKTKSVKTIKLIKKVSGKAYKFLDEQSGVETPPHKRSSEEEDQRAIRLDPDTPGSSIQSFSEVLGAFQHGLHHIYSSAFNLVGSLISSNKIIKKSMSKESVNKLSDLIGNLLFVFLVCYFLLGGGIHLDIMSTVKALEILAEGLECFELVMSSAVVLPALASAIEKTIEFCKSKGLEKIDKFCKSVADNKTKIAQNIFKDLSSDLAEDSLHSSRFSPEMLRSQKKKTSADRSDREQYDYYGNPISEGKRISITESQLRELIRQIINESVM